MTDDDRIKKLPQWAQHEISRLNDNVNYWRNKANAMTTEDAEGTDVFINDYLQGKKLGLPPCSRIGFRVGDGEAGILECSVRDNGDGDMRLNVSAFNGTLIVRPSTSNVIEVVVVRNY